MTTKDKKLDFAAFSSRVENSEKRDFWRSLEELSGDEQFNELLASEFPYMAGEDGPVEESPVDRRQFLKFMGASLAFAGLAACKRPAEGIVPYVNKPEDIVPGKPLFFATAMPLGGAAIGLLVESHEGRPTKIEGNPQHPASLGATDVFSQASVLGLYDPDRSQAVRNLGEISTWDAFVTAIGDRVGLHKGNGGAGLRILTESIVSPTLGQQLQTLMASMPKAVWHQYEPANRDNAKEGARVAFGSYVNPVYDFTKADVVVSLDSDFLASGPAHLRNIKDFTERRRVRSDKTSTIRFYAIESTPTSSGSVADHRIPVRASEVEAYARAIASGVGAGSGAASIRAEHQQWIGALVRDLQAHRGTSLVIAGDDQPPIVHALAHAINGALGNIGQTVSFTDSIEINPTNHGESLRQLVADMNAGQVQTLVMLGGNPVFNAPADFDFVRALQKVEFRVHLSSHYDETSVNTHWHVPEAHYLESWGDARAFDGTASIVQPLIAPLFNGRTAIDVVNAMNGDPTSTYDTVKKYWSGKGGDWNQSLNDGVIAGTAYPTRAMQPNGAAIAGVAPSAAQNSGVEIIFRPDPTLYDGRFANNGWLQELPKPQTKIAWDNVAHLSVATAQRLGLSNEEMVRIHYRGKSIDMPIWITPGHPDESVTVHYGPGRRNVGRVGNGHGFDVYPLRTSDAPSFGTGAQLTTVGKKYPVACTQGHFSMEGRDLVRAGSVTEFAANPRFARKEADDDRRMNLLHGWDYKGNAWGMVVDTSACVGCGGCVVACVAENNISVVGKKEVKRGREMHWLRIDRYYEGNPANPISYHQPVLCQHCENAPCESVCPVEATTHSPEGINEMTYNRCIGTRYCSNNCPYKVRRFNFFAYADFDTPTYKMQRNPDVTTRSRGVMEKCTFCVQRVNRARIEAEKQNRPIRDGEVVTACQAACPADAIVFGNINDKASKVAALKAEPHNYKLVGEINTQPRVTYLATIRNPNPEIKAV